MDSKLKGILDTIGIMIYVNCDQAAQDLLNRAEKNGNLNVEGDEKDPDRHKMIEEIFYIADEDSQHDRVSR